MERKMLKCKKCGKKFCSSDASFNVVIMPVLMQAPSTWLDLCPQCEERFLTDYLGYERGER